MFTHQLTTLINQIKSEISKKYAPQINKLNKEIDKIHMEVGRAFLWSNEDYKATINVKEERRKVDNLQTRVTNLHKDWNGEEDYKVKDAVIRLLEVHNRKDFATAVEVATTEE
jgi:phage host-nuclease inhibitor protein Gam